MGIGAAPLYPSLIGVAGPGRSTQVARRPAAWLLCTSAILAHCDPEEVIGLDTSSDYLSAAQESCIEPRVRFVNGDATVLSFPSKTFDVCVSGLALNFVAFGRSLAEQYRLVRPAGTIAAYVWDYAGEYEFARRFWDAALRIDPRADAFRPRPQGNVLW